MVFFAGLCYVPIYLQPLRLNVLQARFRIMPRVEDLPWVLSLPVLLLFLLAIIFTLIVAHFVVKVAFFLYFKLNLLPTRRALIYLSFGGFESDATLVLRPSDIKGSGMSILDLGNLYSFHLLLR